MASRILPEAAALESLDRYGPAACRGVAYGASILVAAPVLFHLARGSTAYLGLFEDDYYYYALVADKLVTVGRLTFDGTTTTNGFHPLWFLAIALIRALCGRFGPAYYMALTLVSLTSMLVTYELGRRFALGLGVPHGVAAALPAIYSVNTARLLSDGMECVVAVPLLMWLLVETARPEPMSPRRAARLGAIASLAILGRLDLAIAAGLMAGGYLVLARPPVARAWRLLAAFCSAGALVPLYAALNFAFFGSALPVSALAKRLVIRPGFSLGYARAVALGSLFGPSMSVLLPAGLLALILLMRRPPDDRSSSRFAGGLALVFAFVFFGLNALTGWIFFGWYAYPFVPATLAALVFAWQRWAPLLPNRWQLAVVALPVALVPFSAARYFVEHGPGWSVSDNSMLAMSYDLADRMRDRHGLLAMGAIAGLATYVLDRPVVQLEGIVSDRRMVEHLRAQDPLGEVLRAAGADYLIVSLANVRAERRDGCYRVTEPNAEWAGERTAKMSGEICDEPIERFLTPRGRNPWSVFPALETLVWDVRRAHWKGDRDGKVPSEAPPGDSHASE